LLQAANFVATIEQRQGLKIACIEEIALTRGFIGPDQFAALAQQQNNAYGQYMRDLLERPGGQPKSS
jgi:glucose-1-phosphate thymidylyltransferase